MLSFVQGRKLPENIILTITGYTTLLKSVRLRAGVLHDDSFVEDYPVVFVLMYGK
jgi:hypothetical protein